MRGIFRVLFAAVMLCGSNTCWAGENSSPLSISVRAREETVPRGGPIILEVRVVNVSDKSVPLEKYGGQEGIQGAAYLFLVKLSDPDGAIQMSHPLDTIASGGAIRLRPGAEIKEVVQVGKRLDLSRAGPYMIQVSPLVPDQNGDIDAPFWS